MTVKPPYNHIADYPMPIVSVPQPVRLEDELPGVPLDLAVLDGNAWWVQYDVVNSLVGTPEATPRQTRGLQAFTTAEVRRDLTAMGTNARGTGRAWPELALSFDTDAQVIYVRYGAWLWSDAGVMAFARVN